ncbi:FAD-binding oxidoreductase [Roseibium alexandrii]|uniref:FAD/FMN-containing dehydrogenase n=1 Tax=Roseibium alexandrii (strain DSM 17067 / NCIMB 14079 / DFL-11) TaxID=244592 RepID=A0A5E8H1K8_ROSAD|nr:FAD-binding oxidoreductase [Roseibium alexandrii]EEE45688.1 FAD/FMN-containing dehydrogenase [Roseibium alexandrii DFL-11]
MLGSRLLEAENDVLLERLSEIVGPANILALSGDMAAYTEDWTGKYRGEALAVVRPASTAEVTEVVAACAASGVAIVPQGGRTGLCGGGVPVPGKPSVILSLTRMTKIRSLDAAGRTVVAEAGVVLETLQAEVAKSGLAFPLSFGAKGSCTIGGNLATNAGGSNVVRYGNTRELCLGIEAVLPDGSVINALTGLRKDNTGYDFKDLLIGAEGTLGVITAAVFKLFPEPTARATAFLSVASLDQAIEVLNKVQDRTGGAVEAFEYMSQPAIDVICRAFPDIRPPLEGTVETGVLLEVASIRPADGRVLQDGSIGLQNDLMEILAELMEAEFIVDAMLAQSERQRGELWRMRESVLESITANGPAHILDISLPLANVATFVTEMDQEAHSLGFQPLTIGHLGDGNLHYALAAAPSYDWSGLPLETAKEVAFALLTRLNGSFSAEHGIGQSKLPVMTKLKEPAQLAAMRAIKTALDPNNIMNPGKLIPLK